jgi:hypothetical protein
MNIKKLLWVFLALFVFIGLMSGCSERAPMEDGSGGSNDAEGGSLDADLILEDPTRKIYYTVNYGVQSLDLKASIQGINAKVAEYLGYLEDSEEDYTDVDEVNTCTYAKYIYRIPSENLPKFLTYMDTLTGVVDKEISSTDLTTEYNTAEARLETINAAKAAYVTLLETDTLSLSEIISLNSRIEDLDTEISALEKQMSSYEGLLSYSTVTIVFNYKTAGIQTWTLFSDYPGYLFGFVKVILSIFMTVLPFMVITGIVLLVIFLVKRSGKKKKSMKPDAKDQKPIS